MSRRMFHSTLLLLLAIAGLAAGGAESASSNNAPGQSSPGNTSLPSIAGSASVGQTLSASIGTWSGPTPSYSFQWQRCDASGNSCSAVGSGSASYALASGDAGSTLRISVTATNKNGSSVATSSPTPVVGGAPGQTTTTSPTTTTTTTGTTATGTTTTGTTTTGTTTTGMTTTTGTFTTSLAQNGTIKTPYTWTFSAGVPTSAGYFWADGVLLAKITGPGPYSYTLQPGKLAAGAHILGHAWDLSSDGTHHTPPSGYNETVDPATTTTTTTTTASAPTGTVEFNGLATQMNSMTSTGYSSTNNLVQSQDPQVFDGLAYTNNDITLASDGTFGKVFNVSAEPGSRNPYNTTAPANDAMAQLSIRQPTLLGQWRYYGIAVKIPSATWHSPDWSSLMSLGYETFSWDQIALDVNPHGTNGGESFDLMQNSGYLNCPSTTCAGTTSGTWKIADVTYDKWIEFVFAVKWATDNTGAVKVYMRQPGQAWTVALDRENEPTYAYGTSAYGTVSADMHEHTTTLDKFGLYYGYWNSSTTSFPKNTIQTSGLVRATDLATAQSLLP